MSETYPHPCVRCGTCCQMETCPLGQDLYMVGKYEPCPGLEWDGVTAVCRIIRDHPHLVPFMGVGLGCCIKATLYSGGRAHDFASISQEAKRVIAQRKSNAGKEETEKVK